MIYQKDTPNHFVKFNIKFMGDSISNYRDLEKNITKLKKWCKIFHDNDLTQAYSGISYGNLSFRINQNENKFIITASNVGLKDNLSDDCFVKVVSCDLENKIINAIGKKDPSSESMLHYAIYYQRKDINAIFHGHSHKIFEYSNYLGIPTTEKEKPYGTLELVNETLKLSKNNNFFILNNHGFISIGKNMDKVGRKALSYKNLFSITNF